MEYELNPPNGNINEHDDNYAVLFDYEEDHPIPRVQNRSFFGNESKRIWLIVVLAVVLAVIIIVAIELPRRKPKYDIYPNTVTNVHINSTSLTNRSVTIGWTNDNNILLHHARYQVFWSTDNDYHASTLTTESSFVIGPLRSDVKYSVNVAVVYRSLEGKSFRMSTLSQTIHLIFPKSADRILDEFLQQLWLDDMKASPEIATFYGFAISEGNRLWDDVSLEAIAADAARANMERLKLHKLIHYESLSVQSQLSYDAIDVELSLRQEQFHFKTHLMPVSQLDGLHLWLPQVLSKVHLKSVTDCIALLKRLESIAPRIDDTTNLMKVGLEKSHVPASVTMTTFSAQIESIISSTRENSSFFAPFREPLERIMAKEDKSGKKLSDFREKAWNLIQKNVVKPFQRMLEFYYHEYEPALRDIDSIGYSIPNDHGSYYEYLIRYHTTKNINANVLHDLGLAEVKRIYTDMMEVITAHPRGNNTSFSSYLGSIRNDTAYQAQTEADFLKFVRDVALRALGKLPSLFGHLPRCPFSVTSIPSIEAPTAPAAYYMQPGSNCSRPGTYYVNTYDLPSRPLYLFESTTLHETVPGHHLQIALQQEAVFLPQFRRFEGNNAFIEGWALYSESLGKEMGFYTDPVYKFGALGDEMLRACRLVVDTGIHAFGWSRERAITYMMDNTPMSLLDVTSEVDRYITWPGQALSYKVGELTIRSIREHAQKEFGHRFDLRDFHDAVLGSGPLSMDLLEQNVMNTLRHIWSQNTPG